VKANNANNTSGLNSSTGAGFDQCSSVTSPSGVATLQFTENFGTAFKTRVAPTVAYNGQAGYGTTLVQNIPGTIYNSESGFIFNGPLTTGLGGITTGTFLPGLADYGTRLKAVFNSIPAGVHLYVSVTNLAANTSSATTNAPTANTSTTSYAYLIAGEAIPDGNGTIPLLTPTTAVNGSPGVTALYEVTPSATGAVAGAAYAAVWEVINTNPAALETFLFGVWTTYSANPPTSPALGTGMVNMSYAPTPTIPFSASSGIVASSTLTVPRFQDLSGAGVPLITINICQTLLLFPYVTNESGLETGVAISNTSSDPVGTRTQDGTCALSFYNGTTVPGKTIPDTGTIKPGTTYANILSSWVNGPFTGYIFARCNFRFAHGLAFISDAKLANFAMGYLALVINNGSEPNNRGTTIPGEEQGH